MYSTSERNEVRLCRESGRANKASDISRAVRGGAGHVCARAQVGERTRIACIVVAHFTSYFKIPSEELSNRAE